MRQQRLIQQLMRFQSPLHVTFGLACWVSGLATAAEPGLVRTPYAQQQPLAIQSVVAGTNVVPRFSKIELHLAFTATYDNPFEARDVRVDARFESPSGKKLVVPGFLYGDFKRESRNGGERLSPAAAPEWRVRFSPAEVGNYRVSVLVRDRTGQVESAPVTFTATASSSPGHVRVSQKDGRYFAFENEQPFFPIGANTCWAYVRGTYDYDEWFPRYGQAGCNYGRLWLSPNWTTFALERTGKAEDGLGFGQFDLANAWRIDYVLDLAQAHGLWLMLCIDSYNILRVKDGYPQWDNSPHNQQHGGPLSHPTAFWTNGIMERVYLDKLRYLVGRYGYHTHLLAWEFWNEADITTGYNSALSKAWHQRMARALRDLDPFDHLVTTSFAHTPGDPAVDTLPELDYVQTHHYNSPDLVLTLAKAQAQKAAYRKPHFVGEIGADSGGPRCKDDPEGLQIHDPLWISVVTGGAGGAQPWWWDNCIAPQHLYKVFTPMAQFVRDIHWPAEQFQPLGLQVNTMDGDTNAPVLAWGIAGQTTALLWARVRDRTWQRVCSKKEIIPPAPPTQLAIAGLKPGAWRVELWDTWRGVVIEQRRIQVPGSGETHVTLPVIEKDLALKLRRE